MKTLKIFEILLLIGVITMIHNVANAKSKPRRYITIDCTKPSIQQFDFTDEPLTIIVPKPVKMKTQAEIDRQADIDFEDIQNKGGK